MDIRQVRVSSRAEHRVPVRRSRNGLPRMSCRVADAINMPFAQDTADANGLCQSKSPPMHSATTR